MATDRDILVGTLKGELAAVPNVTDLPNELARMTRRRSLKHTFPLTAAVNTNIAEAAFDFAAPSAWQNGYRVLAASYTHSAANTTSSNASPITLTIAKRAQGGASSAVATLNTATVAAGGVGGFVQWNSAAFTVNTVASVVNTNSLLTLTATLPALDTAQNVAIGFVTVEIEAV